MFALSSWSMASSGPLDKILAMLFKVSLLLLSKSGKLSFFKASLKCLFSASAKSISIFLS